MAQPEKETDSVCVCVSKSYFLLHILLLKTLHDPEYVCEYSTGSCWIWRVFKRFRNSNAIAFSYTWNEPMQKRSQALKQNNADYQMWFDCHIRTLSRLFEACTRFHLVWFSLTQTPVWHIFNYTSVSVWRILGMHNSWAQSNLCRTKLFIIHE